MTVNMSNLISSELLRVIAPAKINLHLEVLGLRQDGFHELCMVMQSIDLFDEITFSKTKNGKIELICDNQSLTTGDDNLILKAAKLLKCSRRNKDLGAEIHLKKNIPIGAGLAGGSSDAAATLVGLNELWETKISEMELQGMAAKLGSDIPFCIAGGTQFCFGRGDVLEPFDQLNDSMAVVLVKDPSVAVSTPWAYSRYKELNGRNYFRFEEDFEKRRQLLRRADWANPIDLLNPLPLRNDLQEVVEPVTPAVQKGLKFLSSLNGAISFSMSGSGPSCFAIFANFAAAKIALEQNHEKLELLGLEAWCCSFRSKGVSLDL